MNWQRPLGLGAGATKMVLAGIAMCVVVGFVATQEQQSQLTHVTAGAPQANLTDEGQGEPQPRPPQPIATAPRTHHTQRQSPVSQQLQHEKPIIVASKPFAESYILAEAFALLLEAEGYTVVRRLGLASTDVAFRALVGGNIDIYPEYTGTGLATVLGESPEGYGSAAVFARVSDEFRRRWSAHWLPPLGFENTFAIAIRPELADSLQIRTLSQLARHSPTLTGGFSPDFGGRADGLIGLSSAYGLRLRDSRSLLQAVKYQALLSGEVDVVDGYSTDGAIARYGLVVLADDRNFFPPYDAAALVGQRLFTTRPDAVQVVTRISGRIDETVMRRANERVELGGTEPAQAAEQLLAEVGLGKTTQSEATQSTDAAEPIEVADGRRIRNLPARMWRNRSELASQTGRHIFLVLVSLSAAILVAVPAGLLMERRRSLAELLLRISSLAQTIPGIALLSFMIPLFGIGPTPAIVALFLYSLLPILRNAYIGLIEAAPQAVSAGRALGMTESQLLRRIRLPLATPVIMAGIRTAAVINVGTATLAAFIGGGGLGDPIVAGLALNDPTMILSGAIPAAALALLVDWALSKAEAAVAPGGVKETHP